MKLEVLGCAGGIGGRERFTTCLRVDHDILLDAGTGIANLDLDGLTAIDHVFLTHAHLDHVAGLALLADAVRGRREQPVTVHASGVVIDALKAHLFNWIVWPDFAAIPNAVAPVLRWAPLDAGAAVDIGGRTIAAHAVNHVPGAVAYWVHDGGAGFLFSGDTGTAPALWDAFATQPLLRAVIVDCSFPNEERELANRSMHFCPQSLLDDIRAMPRSVDFRIYHLKPGQEDRIMEELGGSGRSFKALRGGDVFVF